MDRAALYRLMAWLSPSYPVGAFSYSHGIEWLVEDQSVTDAASLEAWLRDILRHGSGRNDAILFACAHRAAAAGDIDALADISAHATAFAASSERHLETAAQGEAFCDITTRTWESPTLARLKAGYARRVAYPVAVAAAAVDHGLALEPSLEAYMHAFAANLISAGVRLVPLGQTDGQRVLIGIEPDVAAVAAEAMGATLSDLGGSAFIADIAAMKHETQYTRLFRT